MRRSQQCPSPNLSHRASDARVAQAQKLLAEWFWTDRWLGSTVRLLSIEARGLYREMLTQAWRWGARLPNDHNQIKRACAVTEDEWARCWPLIEKYWHTDSEGFLVNDTQCEVYRDSQAMAQRGTERGQKGAAARWGKTA